MRISNFLLLLAIAPALAACDLDSVWEQLNKGTTKGFAYCKTATLKQGLSDHLATQFCASRHEKPIENPETLTGQAGYSLTSQPIFAGVMKNNSSQYIITSYTVYVFKKANAMEVNQKRFSGRWVEPNSTDGFEIEYSELTFKLFGEALLSENNWWSVKDVRGLEIAY